MLRQSSIYLAKAKFKHFCQVQHKFKIQQLFSSAGNFVLWVQVRVPPESPSSASSSLQPCFKLSKQKQNRN